MKAIAAIPHTHMPIFAVFICLFLVFFSRYQERDYRRCDYDRRYSDDKILHLCAHCD